MNYKWYALFGPRGNQVGRVGVKQDDKAPRVLLLDVGAALWNGNGYEEVPPEDVAQPAEIIRV